tara:strand:+ start:20595 stop:25838 length:5244 start_codon:yes stop_codon:yes gene_type:complete
MTNSLAKEGEKDKKEKESLRIVGIGASAGGLNAIHELFDALPNNTGLCFVIVQHLSPDFKSLMPELLAKHTTMPIYTAKEGMALQKDCIYLNDRNNNLEIKEGKLSLTDKAPQGKLNLPIDLFLENIGKQFGEDAIGVILSGTGSDGSRGIRYIQEEGGIIMVQEPSSAQFDGMPKSAISTNLCDYILRPTQIGKIITRLSLTAASFRKSLVPLDEQSDIYTNILHAIFSVTGVDFTKYKRNTLLRRLEKRMHLHGQQSLQQYENYIKEHEEELNILGQDFLIGVTSFFRDFEAFQVYSNIIVPSLLKDREDQSVVRIWVPGCSTGEEAYTLAIIMDHYIRENKLDIDFRIFATDIDNRALSYAGMGLYPSNAANEIPRDYLEEYFIKSGNSLRVISRIREKIVFSYHNLINDPPFIRTDLISCRNLLIYLGNEAQKVVQQNFLFSLNQNGFLFLGPSESLLIEEGHYTPVNLKWRVFQKTTTSGSRLRDELSLPRLQLSSRLAASNRKTFNSVHDRERHFHQYISQHFGPSGIFIDEQFNILFIKGDAGRKLILPEGIFQNNLLNIVDQDISLLIRNGTRKLISGEEAAVRFENLLVKRQNENYSFDLTFRKVTGVSELDAVIFIEYSEEKVVDENITISTLDADDINSKKIEALKYELKMTQSDLRNAVEELETSNEELQSANEELMASNEELQSTNEELQSVNEELYTVNTELQEKVEEMLKLNNDISNLLNSTDIGTLFLDQKLCIRKFTPSLKKHFRLEESDRGRPINSFASNFDDQTSSLIMSSAKSALSDLALNELEVSDLEGNYFYFRSSPFITVDRHIDGVILTFVDINKLKETEAKASLSEKRYGDLFRNMNEAFFHAHLIDKSEDENESDWEYLELNPAFERLCKVNMDNIQMKKHSEIRKLVNLPLENWLPNFRESALEGTDQNFEIHIAATNQYFILHIFSPNKGEFAVLFSDITEQKESQEKLQLSLDRVNIAAEISDLALWQWNVKEDYIVEANQEWHNIYGLKTENVKEEWLKILHPDDISATWESIKEHFEGQTSFYKNTFRLKKKGEEKIKWVRNIGKVIEWDERDEPKVVMGASLDITEEKELLIKLENEKLLSEKITENTPGGIYIYDLVKGTNIFSNSQYKEVLGYSIEEMNSLSDKQFQALFHEEDLPKVLEHMGIVASGKSDRLDYRFQHKDGQWVWCRSIDSPFTFDDEGTCTSFIGIFWDVTEEKQATERIRALDLVYRQTLNNSVDAVLQLDLNGKIIFYNNAFKVILAKDKDLVGQKLSDHLPPEASAKLERGLAELKSQKNKDVKPIEFQIEGDTPGLKIWIDGRMTATDTDEHSKIIILSLRNITNRKSYEENLKKAKEAAEEASLHKNYFLANMSHEIRTPMNAILGFTEIMRRDKLKQEEANYYLDIITANSKQLLTVIDDIIDVAKLDTLKIKLIRENCDLIETSKKLKESFGQIRKQLNKERIDIELDLPKGSNKFMVSADIGRLHQILVNLLNNAFKFSTAGKITLGFRKKKSIIEFFVKDKGIGIAKDQQESIFEIFKQVDYGQKDNHGGTGLGLAICKGIVELMQGEIWVESELGKGSTFKFTMPYIEVEDADFEEKEDHSEDTLRELIDGQEVLIAEDNPVNQVLIKAVLNPFNLHLTFANNGREAVDFYLEKKYRLVLMDIRMPELDGLQATKLILKKDPEAYVVAQSAFAMNEQKSEAMKVGFVDYLSKPISRTELYRVLIKAFKTNT